MRFKWPMPHPTTPIELERLATKLFETIPAHQAPGSQAAELFNIREDLYERRRLKLVDVGPSGRRKGEGQLPRLLTQSADFVGSHSHVWRSDLMHHVRLKLRSKLCLSVEFVSVRVLSLFFVEARRQLERGWLSGRRRGFAPGF